MAIEAAKEGRTMAIEVRRDRDMHRAGGWHFSLVDTVLVVDTVLEFRPVGVWATRR